MSEQAPRVNDEQLDEIWDDDDDLPETQADVDTCTIEPYLSELMDRPSQNF